MFLHERTNTNKKERLALVLVTSMQKAVSCDNKDTKASLKGKGEFEPFHSTRGSEGKWINNSDKISFIVKISVKSTSIRTNNARVIIFYSNISGV